LYGGGIWISIFTAHPPGLAHLESSLSDREGQIKKWKQSTPYRRGQLNNQLAKSGISKKWNITRSLAFALKSVFRQNKIGDFETPTNGYNLV